MSTTVKWPSPSQECHVACELIRFDVPRPQLMLCYLLDPYTAYGYSLARANCMVAEGRTMGGKLDMRDVTYS